MDALAKYPNISKDVKISSTISYFWDVIAEFDISLFLHHLKFLLLVKAKDLQE